MKHTMKRALAMIIAILMTISAFAVSEEPIDIDILDKPISIDNGSVEVDLSDTDVDLTDDADDIPMPGDLDLSGALDAQGEQTAEETPAPIPFDQSCTIDGVQFSVTADAAAFPAGASLQVSRVGDEALARTIESSAEAVLQDEGRLIHHLYRIDVFDSENNACLPNHDRLLPQVTVAGLAVNGAVRVTVFDTAEKSSHEIEATKEDAIVFRFVDSTVYDIVKVTPEASADAGEPEQPMDEEQPEQSLDQSEPEQPVDEEQPEQPVDEEQPEQPVDEEQPEQPVNEEQPEQPVDEEQPEQPVDEEQPEQPADEEQPEQPVDEEQPEQPEEKAPSEDTVVLEQGLEEELTQKPAVTEEAEASELAESVPFDQSRTVNGVVVTVKAKPGAFPKGAVLSVEYVPEYQAREAEEAVGEVRDENQNVAVSYTFDIKVIDPETGDEIQPAEGQSVSVSFALAEVTDENLDTQVYHITEDEKTGETSAESLDVKQKVTEDTGEKSTAEVRTDGFSLYKLELTYDDMAYAMQDSSVALSDILASVGLKGEVSAVEVSDAALFSAEMSNGQWLLTAHRSFDSAQMNVTVNGVAYGITVSNAVSKAKVNYLDRHAIGYSTQALVELDGTAEAIKLSTETSDMLGGEWYVVDTNITRDKPVRIDGKVNLILKNGVTLNAKKGIIVPAGSTLHIYGQKGESGSLVAKGDDSAGIGGEDKKDTGKIYIHGGKIEATGDKHDAGIGSGAYSKISAITIYGGQITANGGKGGAGIGTGFVGGDMAPITIFGGNIKAVGGRNYDNGGEDDECGAGIGGGCYTNCGKVTIYGGTIYAEGKNNSAAIGGGADDEPYQWYTDVNGAGGDVSIMGGKVTVKSVSIHAQCIGCGQNDCFPYPGTLTLGTDMKVTKGSTTVKKGSRESACHSFKTTVVIQKCDHPENIITINENTHEASCDFCKMAFGKEKHIFNNKGVCTVCGYQAGYCSVSFTDNGMLIASKSVPKCSNITPLDAPQKRGRTFRCWQKDGKDFDFSTVILEDTVLTTSWSHNAIRVFAVADQVYTGNGLTPAVTVKDKSETLVEGVDYIVSFSDNINVGTATATVTGKGDYDGSDPVRVAFNITRAPINPVVHIAGWTYGETPSQPSVTDNPGNGAVTYTYAIRNGSDYSAQVPTEAGSYTVKATVAETDNYMVGEGTANFVISPATLTIRVSIRDWTYGQTPSQPSVSGNPSGTTVKFTYSARGNNLYSEAVPTEAGLYTVRATCLRTVNYLTAMATADFEIKKANIQPQITIPDWTYGESEQRPQVKNNPGGGTVSYAYKRKSDPESAYSAVVPSEAGDYIVKAIVAETANYESGTATKDFAIRKAHIHPRLMIDDWIYGKTPSTPVLAGNSGNGNVTCVYYKDNNGSWKPLGTDAPTDAGRYAAKATVAETDNYAGASTDYEAFDILRAEITITANDVSSQQGSLAPLDGQWGITGDFKAEDTIKGISASTTATAQSQPGYYPILLTCDAALNPNYSITLQPGTYTVLLNDVKVWAKDYNGVYDGNSYGIDFKVSGGNAECYFSENKLDENNYKNGKKEKPLYSQAGKYITYYYVTDKTAYHVAGYKTVNIRKFTDNADAAGRRPTANTLTYSGKAQNLIAAPATDPKSYGYTLNYSADNGATWSATIPTGTDVGVYTVMVKYVGDSNHNDFTIDALRCTISKADPKVSAPTAIAGLTYTGAAQALVNAGSTDGGELRYVAGIDSDSAPADGWGTDIPTAADAGTYYVWYRVEGGDNYNDVDEQCVKATIAPKSIARAKLELSPKDSFTYDGAEKEVAVTAVVMDGKALNPADYVLSSVLSEWDASTYTVTATGKGNYKDSASATWTINPCPMTDIVVQDVNVPYDGKPHGIFVPYTGSAAIEYGTKEGVYNLKESPTLTDAGKLDVYFRIPPLRNYRELAGHATITVTKLPIRPVALIDGWTYGKTPNAPTVQGNTGNGAVTISYSDVLEGPYTPGVPTQAGTWYVMASVAESENYLAATTDPRSFVISKANITITADDKSSKYGDRMQKLTWKVSGDYQTADALTVTATTTATEKSAVGEYPIVLEWEANNNYNAHLKNGKYTITRTDLKVTASDYSGEYDGKPHGIIVNTGESDAKVYYGTVELTSKNYATTGSLTELTYTDVGKYTVYYYVSTGNYNPDAVRGSKVVTITKTQSHPQAYQKPAANNTVYNATEQELVIPPERLLAGYTLRYSIDDGKTWKTAVPKATDAGGYTVKVKFDGDKNHVDFMGEDVKSVIDKATVTVTADDQWKLAGSADPTLTYIVSGLMEGDNLTGALSRESGEGVGTYKITQGTLRASNNYKLVFKGAELTISLYPQPTAKPTAKPTAEPTGAPTAKPTAKPTAEPTPKPAKPSYTLLARMTSSTSNKTSLKISWTKVKGTSGYDIYFANCGSNIAYLASVSASASRSYKVTGLKNRKTYKACVKAWKIENGIKTYIGKASPTVHAIAGGYNAKYTDVKSVRLNKKSVTLNKGQRIKLSATVKGVKADRQSLDHAKTIRWFSSNTNVAKVNGNGRITAVDGGKCTLYAVANNGVTASVRVNVVSEPKKIDFKKKSYSVKRNETLKLAKEIVFTPSGSRSALTWISSDPSVATVNSRGVVKGLKKGTVTINVTTANGKKASTKIRVK